MSTIPGLPIGAQTVNSGDASKLPESLGWYRDGGNWLVGLSGAAIAGGLVHLDKLSNSPLRAATLFFVLALIFFLLALLAGVLFYFWIVSYANQIEQRKKTKEAHDAATGADKDRLGEELKTAESNAGSALRSVKRLHGAMLWCFFAGVALALLAGLLQVFFAERAEGPWTVQTHVYTDAACQCSRYVIIRVNSASGATWTLIETSPGVFTWRAFGVEPPKSTDTKSPGVVK